MGSLRFAIALLIVGLVMPYGSLCLESSVSIDAMAAGSHVCEDTHSCSRKGLAEHTTAEHSHSGRSAGDAAALSLSCGCGGHDTDSSEARSMREWIGSVSSVRLAALVPNRMLESKSSLRRLTPFLEITDPPPRNS